LAEINRIVTGDLRGDHASLLARGGTYARLYRAHRGSDEG
jgi:ABC-type multidrug transport system fused ATPase/permease subunit